jgi:1-deoxy-D-xylulose-5-phosphate synthase
MQIARNRTDIIAITAAMSKGTGLDAFARHYPSRFFDVGIAEQHAVTFAGGLAAGGLVPIVCLYSTFMQRAVDQIIHDVALQNAHVVFVFDRAGIVPGDGETHQGMFDISLLRPVPNMTIITPVSAADLELCLSWAVSLGAPVVIRYPKMSCPSELATFSTPVEKGRGLLIQCTEFAAALSPPELSSVTRKVLFVCTGGMYSEVLVAARSLLMKGVYADIYELRFIKPVDENYFVSLARAYTAVVIVEDGIKSGGVGEYLENVILRSGLTRVSVMAFPDRFLPQGTRAEICEDAGMSPEDIAGTALNLLGSHCAVHDGGVKVVYIHKVEEHE